MSSQTYYGQLRETYKESHWEYEQNRRAGHMSRKWLPRGCDFSTSTPDKGHGRHDELFLSRRRAGLRYLEGNEEELFLPASKMRDDEERSVQRRRSLESYAPSTAPRRSEKNFLQGQYQEDIDIIHTQRPVLVVFGDNEAERILEEQKLEAARQEVARLEEAQQRRRSVASRESIDTNRVNRRLSLEELDENNHVATDNHQGAHQSKVSTPSPFQPKDLESSEVHQDHPATKIEPREPVAFYCDLSAEDSEERPPTTRLKGIRRTAERQSQAWDIMLGPASKHKPMLTSGSQSRGVRSTPQNKSIQMKETGRTQESHDLLDTVQTIFTSMRASDEGATPSVYSSESGRAVLPKGEEPHLRSVAMSTDSTAMADEYTQMSPRQATTPANTSKPRASHQSTQMSPRSAEAPRSSWPLIDVTDEATQMSPRSVESDSMRRMTTVRTSTATNDDEATQVFSPRDKLYDAMASMPSTARNDESEALHTTPTDDKPKNALSMQSLTRESTGTSPILEVSDGFTQMSPRVIDQNVKNDSYDASMRMPKEEGTRASAFSEDSTQTSPQRNDSTVHFSTATSDAYYTDMSPRYPTVEQNEKAYLNSLTPGVPHVTNFSSDGSSQVKVPLPLARAPASRLRAAAASVRSLAIGDDEYANESERKSDRTTVNGSRSVDKPEDRTSLRAASDALRWAANAARQKSRAVLPSPLPKPKQRSSERTPIANNDDVSLQAAAAALRLTTTSAIDTRGLTDVQAIAAQDLSTRRHFSLKTAADLIRQSEHLVPNAQQQESRTTSVSPTALSLKAAADAVRRTAMIKDRRAGKSTRVSTSADREYRATLHEVAEALRNAANSNFQTISEKSNANENHISVHKNKNIIASLHEAAVTDILDDEDEALKIEELLLGVDRDENDQAAVPTVNDYTESETSPAIRHLHDGPHHEVLGEDSDAVQLPGQTSHQITKAEDEVRKKNTLAPEDRDIASDNNWNRTKSAYRFDDTALPAHDEFSAQASKVEPREPGKISMASTEVVSPDCFASKGKSPLSTHSMHSLGLADEFGESRTQVALAHNDYSKFDGVTFSGGAPASARSRQLFGQIKDQRSPEESVGDKSPASQESVGRNEWSNCDDSAISSEAPASGRSRQSLGQTKDSIFAQNKDEAQSHGHMDRLDTGDKIDRMSPSSQQSLGREAVFDDGAMSRGRPMSARSRRLLGQRSDSVYADEKSDGKTPASQQSDSLAVRSVFGESMCTDEAPVSARSQNSLGQRSEAVLYDGTSSGEAPTSARSQQSPGQKSDSVFEDKQADNISTFSQQFHDQDSRFPSNDVETSGGTSMSARSRQSLNQSSTANFAEKHARGKSPSSQQPLARVGDLDDGDECDGMSPLSLGQKSESVLHDGTMSGEAQLSTRSRRSIDQGSDSNFANKEFEEKTPGSEQSLSQTTKSVFGGVAPGGESRLSARSQQSLGQESISVFGDDVHTVEVSVPRSQVSLEAGEALDGISPLSQQSLDHKDESATVDNEINPGKSPTSQQSLGLSQDSVFASKDVVKEDSTEMLSSSGRAVPDNEGSSACITSPKIDPDDLSSAVDVAIEGNKIETPRISLQKQRSLQFADDKTTTTSKTPLSNVDVLRMAGDAVRGRSSDQAKRTPKGKRTPRRSAPSTVASRYSPDAAISFDHTTTLPASATPGSKIQHKPVDAQTSSQGTIHETTEKKLHNSSSTSQEIEASLRKITSMLISLDKDRVRSPRRTRGVALRRSPSPKKKRTESLPRRRSLSPRRSWADSAHLVPVPVSTIEANEERDLSRAKITSRAVREEIEDMYTPYPTLRASHRIPIILPASEPQWRRLVSSPMLEQRRRLPPPLTEPSSPALLGAGHDDLNPDDAELNAQLEQYFDRASPPDRAETSIAVDAAN